MPASSLPMLCLQIAEQARYVTLNEDKLAEMAAAAPEELLQTPEWRESPGDFDSHADDVITWLVTYNAINFSYYPEHGERRWFARVDGQEVGRDDEALGIMAIIGSFQVFTQAFVMTRGEPGDLTRFYVLYLYNQAFDFYEMGYASAMAWLLLVVVLALTVPVLRGSRRHVHYEALS